MADDKKPVDQVRGVAPEEMPKTSLMAMEELAKTIYRAGKKYEVGPDRMIGLLLTLIGAIVDQLPSMGNAAAAALRSVAADIEQEHGSDRAVVVREHGETVQ